jgi:sec-independent protein translocase protein TatA
MGLGLPHLILILVILLIFFGPSRLPGLGKSFGEAIRGFKKGLNEDAEIDVTPKTKLNSNEPAATASAASSERDKSKS